MAPPDVRAIIPKIPGWHNLRKKDIAGDVPGNTWLKVREWMARQLGLGDITLAGRMPSGHYGILMPQRMYLIDRARVDLAGVGLGAPARVRPNPKIGDVALPARGIFLHQGEGLYHAELPRLWQRFDTGPLSL